MSAFGTVGPNRQRLEEGSGAPPENLHLLAHQAAVRTQEMAAGFADQLASVQKAAVDLAASSDDAAKRSLAAHKDLLARQPAAPVAPADMKALQEENAALKARLDSGGSGHGFGDRDFERRGPKFGSQVSSGGLVSGGTASGGTVSSGGFSSSPPFTPVSATTTTPAPVFSGGTSSGSV